MQTSYHGQFMLRNSNKPTKTEQCTLFQLIYIGSSKLWKIYVVGYCLGGSDRIGVQSFHLNIVLAAAVGNAITASKVTARKNLGISSSTVLIVNNLCSVRISVMKRMTRPSIWAASLTSEINDIRSLQYQEKIIWMKYCNQQK